MKNGVALLSGALMILAALFLAAGASSQDHTPRPQIAQALATDLHVTPSATPRPTFTPIPTATPLRLTRPDPSDQEILDSLFQYPYWRAYIIPSPTHLSVHRLQVDGLAPALIIAGDGATATDGYQVYPAAFGAVLTRDGEGYVRKFLRVQFGHRDAQVSASISPQGRIVFTFRDLGSDGPGVSVLSQQTIVLNSCEADPRLVQLWALDRRWQTGIEFECF